MDGCHRVRASRGHRQPPDVPPARAEKSHAPLSHGRLGVRPGDHAAALYDGQLRDHGIVVLDRGDKRRGGGRGDHVEVSGAVRASVGG